MAIVVNNPSERADSGGSEVANLMIALAVIVVLVLGALYLLPRVANRGTVAPAAPGANINVTLPSGTGVGGGGTGQGPAPQQ